MRRYNLSFLAKAGLAMCAALVLHCAAWAQCGGLITKTYDTVLNSNGFADFNLSFPQFSPDSGTLVSVKLSATVSSVYGYTLRNADIMPATYLLNIGQQDEFTSPQLTVPFSNVMTQPMGNFPLSPGQSVTQSPFNFLSNHISSDSITSVTSFLGTGQVSIDYQSFTFTNLAAVENATYYYSAAISNTATFSVQYLFCRSSAVLPTDLTNWSATPGTSGNVELNWATTNETAGRQYVIQRSTDRHIYTNIATLPANANEETASYNYPDELPSDADSNWYYRLQILDAAGQISYSDVKLVTLGTAGKGLLVYPNPVSEYINLVPDRQEASDWQVDIMSANGNLIQRNSYMQTRMMQVNFNQKLSAGIYFVRATDLRGQRFYTSSFLVAGSH